MIRLQGKYRSGVDNEFERRLARMTVWDHLRWFLLLEADCSDLFTPSETDLNGNMTESIPALTLNNLGQKKEGRRCIDQR